MTPSIGDIWKWEPGSFTEPQYLLVLDKKDREWLCLNINKNEIGSWFMHTEDKDEGPDWEWVA